MQWCLEPLAVLVVAIALRLRPLGALMEAFALFAAVPPAADERGGWFIIRRPMTVIHSLTRSVGTCRIDRILRVRPHHKADGRAAGEDETNNHLIKQTSESDRIIKWTAGPSGRAKQTTISQSGPPRTMRDTCERMY